MSCMIFDRSNTTIEQRTLANELEQFNSKNTLFDDHFQKY